jgi:hypothetical protein
MFPQSAEIYDHGNRSGPVPGRIQKIGNGVSGTLPVVDMAIRRRFVTHIPSCRQPETIKLRFQFWRCSIRQHPARIAVAQSAEAEL